ncbi:MAG: CD1871A family CXXC motif-containing protein [Thermodesulfobacteriota bacterium]
MAKKSSRLPLGLLIGFLVLFVVGLNAGEVSAVFEKAATICMSCIGIG